MESSEGQGRVQHRTALKEDLAPLQGTTNLKPSAVCSKWSLSVFNCSTAFQLVPVVGFCVNREKYPLSESYSWYLWQHCWVTDDSPFEVHISCVSVAESVWGGWLGHRYLSLGGRKAQFWGTKRYLSETFVNSLIWSYFSSTKLDFFCLSYLAAYE